MFKIVMFIYVYKVNVLYVNIFKLFLVLNVFFVYVVCLIKVKMILILDKMNDS